MFFFFILENKGIKDLRSNESLFGLVSKYKIPEENIYFDTDGEGIIYEMIDKMSKGDTLIVKRLDDLAETNKELQRVLEMMESKEINLATEEHKGLNGIKYYSAILAAQDISNFYKEKRRQVAYLQSVERGLVGRPHKKKELDTAIKLYNSGQFSIKEIEELSKISSSTLFRHLKNQDTKSVKQI